MTRRGSVHRSRRSSLRTALSNAFISLKSYIMNLKWRGLPVPSTRPKRFHVFRSKFWGLRSKLRRYTVPKVCWSLSINGLLGSKDYLHIPGISKMRTCAYAGIPKQLMKGRLIRGFGMTFCWISGSCSWTSRHTRRGEPESQSSPLVTQDGFA